MKIAFEKKSKNPFDLLIKLRTLSNYYHCEIVFDKVAAGICWSAKAFEGVRFKTVDLSTDFDVYDLPSVSLSDELKCYKWAMSQCGKDYDYWGLIGVGAMPINTDIHDKNDLYCSESNLKCFQVNLNWFPGIEAFEVSPAGLFKLLKDKKEIV